MADGRIALRLFMAVIISTSTGTPRWDTHKHAHKQTHAGADTHTHTCMLTPHTNTHRAEWYQCQLKDSLLELYWHKTLRGSLHLPNHGKSLFLMSGCHTRGDCNDSSEQGRKEPLLQLIMESLDLSCVLLYLIAPPLCYFEFLYYFISLHRMSQVLWLADACVLIWVLVLSLWVIRVSA